MYDINVRIGFKTHLQSLAIQQMLQDLSMSWADVLRIGLDTLDKKKQNLKLINEMDTHLDAYFYLRQSKNDEGIRTWNINKVILDKGRAKNYIRVKIYEITKLSDVNVIILYTDPNTKQGEFKSIKKLIKDVDIQIMQKFFGKQESRGFIHHG